MNNSVFSQNNGRYGYRVLGEGVYVSNDTRSTHLNNNDLIIGKSGASKSGSIVDPNLKLVNDSSVILTDTKRLFHRRFRERFEAKGYRVVVLDFVDTEKGCGYNPLAYIRRDPKGHYNEQDIGTVAGCIVPSMDLNEPIWESSARLYLQLFISYCLDACPGDRHDMITVSDIYHRFISGSPEILEWIVDHPDSFTAMKYAEIKANREADKMVASIYGFLNVAMSPFCMEQAKTLFRNDNMIDIASIGREKTILFLNVSDMDRTWDNLINLFYSQAFSILVRQADDNPDGMSEIPVRFIMDDFASNAVIPDFDKIISVIRSRDIYVTLIIQSKTQLNTMYGPDTATSIINNCDHIVYMGANDLGTADFIAVWANTSPEKVLAMEVYKSYLIEGGQRARLIEKIPPYSFEC